MRYYFYDFLNGVLLARKWSLHVRGKKLHIIRPFNLAVLMAGSSTGIN
jgi:hypothetical protein